MIYFCEECGEKYKLPFDKKQGNIDNFKCSICKQRVRLLNLTVGNETSEENVLLDGVNKKSMPDKRIYKLLIVDDSKFIRRVIRNIFDASDNIEVAGEAENGAEALEMIAGLNPDVVTLDINMPVMDGLTTLKHVMIGNPTPAVMLSTLTHEGARKTFDALKYGAVDFIKKPSRFIDIDLEKQQQNIIKKVILAAEVEIETVRYLRSISKNKYPKKDKKIRCDYIFAIGAAEGGYGALLKIIPYLKPDLPAAFLVVLYAAPQHVDAFVRYLADYSYLRVKRAKDREPIEGGVCYFASGEEYLTLYSLNSIYFLRVASSPFPDRRGSINMLMFSIAETFREHAAGAILSGSSNDGVEGLGEILRNGGSAIVQDPKSCLCKESAKIAIDRCMIDTVVSDSKMAAEINNFFV